MYFFNICWQIHARSFEFSLHNLRDNLKYKFVNISCQYLRYQLRIFCNTFCFPTQQFLFYLLSFFDGNNRLTKCPPLFSPLQSFTQNINSPGEFQCHDPACSNRNWDNVQGVWQILETEVRLCHLDHQMRNQYTWNLQNQKNKL